VSLLTSIEHSDKYIHIQSSELVQLGSTLHELNVITAEIHTANWALGAAKVNQNVQATVGQQIVCED